MIYHVEFQFIMLSFKGKKGFTIIELIVVMAIIGILVLLAAPRFLGYVQKAHLARIQNDVKAAENVVGAELVHSDSLDKWGKPVDINLEELKNEKKLYTTKGLLTEKDEIEDGPYWKIDQSEFKSKLKGSFYANQGGKVYYEDTKSGNIDNPGKPNNKTPEEIIDDLENKLPGIKDDVDKLGPDSSYEDIANIEKDIDQAEKDIKDAQDKIDEMEDGPDKDKAQEDLDKIKDKLEEIVEGMEPGDKSKLTNRLEEVKALKKDDYETGWDELQKAIQQAEAVINKSKPTQAEITIAIENLNKAVDQLIKKTTSPGPDKPIEGATDGVYTFYGEVSTGDLISGNELASKIGLSKGTAYNNTEPWLKFTRKDKDGKLTTMYVAKKPYKHSISWNHINAVGAVFGNGEKTKELNINGQKYRVRLLKGANKDPITDADSDFHNSEWNKIMLPIHEQAINKNWAYPTYVGPKDAAEFKHGLGKGANKRYTDADLLTHNSYGNGSYSWTQESSGSSRVLRGGYGVSDGGWRASSSGDYGYSWRPVLELVGD